MDPAIQSTLITALAGVLGAAVGGLSSFATTLVTQGRVARRDLLSKDLAQREVLYADLIREATTLFIDSLDRTLDRPGGLIVLFALIGRIRLISAPTVLLAAENLAEEIIESYGRPDMSFNEAHKMMRGRDVDPLRKFTQACREEREAMLGRL